jgi:1,4-dihydroxy-2-naphthoyl-CoA hydrolase
MDSRRLVSSEDQGGLLKTLGFRAVEVSADRAVITWEVGEEHLQSYGMVHGGVFCSAVETAASYGAVASRDGQGRVVGVANSTDFLRAAVAGTVSAVATPIHRGRSQQLWVVEISDEEGRLYARGQVRFQNLD